MKVTALLVFASLSTLSLAYLPAKLGERTPGCCGGPAGTGTHCCKYGSKRSLEKYGRVQDIPVSELHFADDGHANIPEGATNIAKREELEAMVKRGEDNSDNPGKNTSSFSCLP